MPNVKIFTLKATPVEKVDLINTLKNSILFTPPEVENFYVDVKKVTSNKGNYTVTLDLNYTVKERYTVGPDYDLYSDIRTTNLSFKIGRLNSSDKVVLDTNKQVQLSTILNQITSIQETKSRYSSKNPNDEFVVKTRYIGDMTKGAGSWIYKSWHGKMLPLKETNTMFLNSFDSDDYHLNNAIFDAQRDTVVETNEAVYTTSSKANDVDHLFLAYDIFKKNGNELVKVHSGQPMVVELITKDKAALGTK